MGITAQFRPAQHQYQSTYDPFPYKDLAPLAMKFQQENMAGMDKTLAANTMIAGSVIASADQEEGARKVDELTQKVSSVADKNKSFRSPEFHMNLNKVISDFKGDDWFKKTAANAKMEQEYNKILANDNLSEADKLPIREEYDKFKTLGTKDYGLLTSPTTPKRGDYSKELDAQGEGYAKESWARNGTLTVGTRQDEIAYGYGISRGSDGQWQVDTIKQGWLGTDAGKSLIRDAKYAAKLEGTEFRDELKKLYLSETVPLVYKHAGSIDRAGTGEGEDYKGLNFQSYMSEHSALTGSRRSEEAFNSLNDSESLEIWDTIKNLPGYKAIDNMAKNFLAKMDTAGMDDEDIRTEINDFQQRIFDDLKSVIGKNSVLGVGASLAISKALSTPLEYGLTTQVPDVEELSQDHKNILHRMLENDDIRARYEKEGLTEELWEEMEKTTMKFYEDGTWTDIGLTVDEDADIPKYIKQTTGRLFGIGADKGKIEVGAEGGLPGMISQHIIIDPDTNEKIKIKDMDLPAGEDVVVEFKGILDPRNQYGPQTLAVHIDGKEYYVVGQNPSVEAVRANRLHSYEFNFSNIGAEFNTGLVDNGKSVKATPAYNYETKQYELTMSNGDIYGSSTSIEDAYKQYLLTTKKKK